MIWLVLGVTLLIFVLRDIFQTVVVPRGKRTGFRIAPPMVRNVFWPLFRFVAAKIKAPVLKAEVLGMFGPFLFMMLLTVWMALLICGFGLISFALSSEYSPHVESLTTALYVSGSSVLTLGSSEYINKSGKVRFLMLAAAFTGMIVTASVVSLLFTLIASIQRREVLVAITSNVAGSPPSGIAILETYLSKNGRQSLGNFYDEWHHWCADVLETHKAYPILPYFRSNDPLTSWLTALGAVLDSTALLLSVEPEADFLAVRLTYQFGCTLVNDLAQSWHVEMVQTDQPDQSEPPTTTAEQPTTAAATETSVTTNATIANAIASANANVVANANAIATAHDGDEFHRLYARILVQAGNDCLSTEATARSNFARLRQEYLPAHRALCNHMAVPQTPLATEYHLSLPPLITPPPLPM